MAKSEKAKEYEKCYYELNKDKIKEQKRLHYEENREAIRARQGKYVLPDEYKERRKAKKNERYKVYYTENKENVKKRTDDWKRRNPGKRNAIHAKRRAAKLKATPPWLTKEQLLEIQDFYILAKELQWLSEEPLHVDHIYPLQGENSCGLHVPWNLQIISESKNQQKYNKLP